VGVIAQWVPVGAIGVWLVGPRLLAEVRTFKAWARAPRHGGRVRQFCKAGTTAWCRCSAVAVPSIVPVLSTFSWLSSLGHVPVAVGAQCAPPSRR